MRTSLVVPVITVEIKTPVFSSAPKTHIKAVYFHMMNPLLRFFRRLNLRDELSIRTNQRDKLDREEAQPQ